MANRGEKHHSAKMTEARVRAIRYLYWVKGIDSRCLSRLYGYNTQTLWDCVNYATWKHVKDNFTADQIVRVLNEDKKYHRLEVKEKKNV